MEPKDKYSLEWRDWFVRRKFGGSTILAIRLGTTQELEVLQKYIEDLLIEKQKNLR